MPGATFRRLPYNFCAVSLQPFKTPYCTAEGTIFDIENILPWLKKHGTNPVDGKPMKRSELFKLNFAKNDDDEYVDPVTFKPFTDNSHIVALRNTGNVFAWDTLERLNIKAKNWRDLVSNDEFSRKDLVTLQDPQHLEGRDLSSFKYLKDGTSMLTEEQERERNDPANNVNLAAMGSSAKLLKAKEAVAKARAERMAGGDPNRSNKTNSALANTTMLGGQSNGASYSMSAPAVTPYNAAKHTTGKAAASFTSTGLTPHTGAERALLSDEEYMLHPRRVKEQGYARIHTTQGTLDIELHTEFAPRAVWNFVQLAKRGYYSGVAFHRNIRNFMIQGGDPTGSGRGGTSVWGKQFVDEWAQSPLTHTARGTVSMANKGKNTNTSQFFVTYRAATHLDRKHTIFAKVVGDESEATLKRLEAVPTDSGDRPTEECRIESVDIFVDPFEEFARKRREKEGAEREQEEVERNGGTEDDSTTWTGKRIRADGTVERMGGGGVGKYLEQAMKAPPPPEALRAVAAEEEWEFADEILAPPPAKKRKAGGFGNFDGW